MHSFGLRGCAPENFYGIKSGDFLVFCMGEIDIREHMHKQELKGRKIKQIVNEIVINYVNKIKFYTKRYSTISIIFGPIPPYHKDRHIKKEKAPPESFGSVLSRVVYNRMINKFKLSRAYARKKRVNMHILIQEHSKGSV